MRYFMYISDQKCIAVEVVVDGNAVLSGGRVKSIIPQFGISFPGDPEIEIKCLPEFITVVYRIFWQVLSENFQVGLLWQCCSFLFTPEFRAIPKCNQ